MKQALACLLYWSYVQLSVSFPVEEKPGFTLWPLGKRDLTPLTELQYSGLRGTQIGVFEKSHFGIPDPTCRNRLPQEGCWTMDQFTVDKMIDAREPKANNCPLSCLFYTEKLSGAAERLSNSVLWDLLSKVAEEGQGKYQTIWDLHARKYYPRDIDLDATPETKCAYLDTEKLDEVSGFNGCQRLYFMSMSKAMATQCSGEVFLMTTTNLKEKQDVPENGIWWQVEFPTLIDETRAEDKKITKISYIQVDPIDKFQLAELQKAEIKTAPKVKFTGEYWPNGVGEEHLKRFNDRAGKQGDSSQKGSFITSSHQEESWQDNTPAAMGFVKRAVDRSDTPICEYGEECYPFPYPINDMYEAYKDIW